ncbi:excalibur calcium-binding domain-containing protein [Bacillus cereus]|uniref:excalibur calcium-binding domain-containing protein n=1 Tax=Bacillus cereus TaxID=1396 RepID=UPI00065B8EC5|nr:excalibur calcium-binding domain-containing protein [Bacillus cereus]KMP50525.1 hypothetical protein TU59_21235 [Bacillus cereus]UDV85393.1 excalibur calcium-binding domain-containing protein [Bacillus cereus]UDV90947.1 excalibur calcium-binding domain-containing protein [Bacillus cereus]
MVFFSLSPKSEKAKDTKVKTTAAEVKQEDKDKQKENEEKQKAEEQKKLDEQKKLEEQKKAEEQKRLDEQRKQEEAQRQQEEQKKQQEAAQAKEQEQQAAPKQEKVHFANCTDANNAGYYDITPDSPAYASHLDRDGDGVACERNKGHKKSSKKH